MNNKNHRLLKKEIKQIKAVVCAFRYKYFAPPVSVGDMSPEELEEFNRFRNDTLFKLVDQWKKMELELLGMEGRL